MAQPFSLRIGKHHIGSLTISVRRHAICPISSSYVRGLRMEVIAMALEELRKNGMMAHLLDALDGGQDIGHYGRLVFAMVARHFLEDEELVELLRKNPGFDETQAKALVEQVSSRDYNPPRRERIREWQQ